eukprot:363901-Chlamydomonas_euryale.AAC.3
MDMLASCSEPPLLLHMFLHACPLCTQPPCTSIAAQGPTPMRLERRTRVNLTRCPCAFGSPLSVRWPDSSPG